MALALKPVPRAVGFLATGCWHPKWMKLGARDGINAAAKGFGVKDSSLGALNRARLEYLHTACL